MPWTKQCDDDYEVEVTHILYRHRDGTDRYQLSLSDVSLVALGGPGFRASHDKAVIESLEADPAHEVTVVNLGRRWISELRLAGFCV